jgi:integrase-like protein
VKEFITWRFASSRLKPNTVTDTKHRLGKFAEYFGDTALNQITPEQLDKFLLTRKAGGDRGSYWKRLKPL